MHRATLTSVLRQTAYAGPKLVVCHDRNVPNRWQADWDKKKVTIKVVTLANHVDVRRTTAIQSDISGVASSACNRDAGAK